MLFRIAFMTEEKKLGQTLALLQKIGVHNMEVPVPAVHVDERPVMDVLKEELAGRRQVIRQDIRAIVEGLGRGGSSYAYYAKQLITTGFLRPAGTRGLYNVVGAVAKTKKKKGAK